MVNLRCCSLFLFLLLSLSMNGNGGGCVVQAWIPTTTIARTPLVPRQQGQGSLSSSSTTSSLNMIATIRKAGKRFRDSITSQERSREELKIGIAGFYDRSSRLWEDVWGEHMHHGYYIPENRTDHVQAQIDMIDQVLTWAGVGVGAADGVLVNADTDATTKGDSSASSHMSVPRKVVDVGCGIGGSSRHIASKFGCKSVQGITLSPYQAQRGNELAKEMNLDDNCHFQVADALDMPFRSNSFDLVWSLESGEHMPDKPKFVSELFRVCEPGGRIIVVTWCHRDLNTSEGESSLTKSELHLLKKINRAYYLPEWCSVQDYVDLFGKLGAQNIRREDWSYVIAPFWKAVIQSSLNWRSLVGLVKAGFTTQRGAIAMLLMLRGYQKGLIKFGLITCTKPNVDSYRDVLTGGAGGGGGGKQV